MFNKIKNFISKKSSPPFSGQREISLSSSIVYNYLAEVFDGEKYPGGLGSEAIDFFAIDYWTLRSRSYRFFTENRYAKGLIKRLVTNVIHKGLGLEAVPDGKILDLSDDFINEWTEEVETRFDLWAGSKELVSYNFQLDFSEIQQEVYRIALLSGDVLVVLREDSVTKLPTIQLIDGIHIRTPFNPSSSITNEIRHGVELDDYGKHIAYYVKDFKDKSGVKSIRIPVKGEKTGRLIAWMVYDQKIRIDDVRGMPLLGIILQALKELDRYSDAEQRAAVLNAIVALGIKRTAKKPASKAISSHAVRRDKIDIKEGSTASPTNLNVSEYLPGMIVENLQEGEQLESFSAARPNVNYRAYEEALTASMAWTEEIPPNIYRLAYSSNYSASTAELNEFKMFLDKKRFNFAGSFNKRFYPELLLSLVLADYVSAPGFLRAWRSDNIFEYLSWTASDWIGAIKPSMRFIQEIKAYENAIENGFTTRTQASRLLFGNKYETNIRRLIKENDLLAKAAEPMIAAGLVKDENQETSSHPESSSASVISQRQILDNNAIN